MSKNVTFRFKESDLEKYDNFATKIGVNRTTLVRNAIEKYIDSYDGNAKKEPGIIETGKRAVGITSELESLYEHPLYVLIRTEGLKINDEEGRSVATVTDLKSLFNFVNTKVLQK